MRVTVKRLNRLTPDEWERCSRLNFGEHGGDMWKAMRDYRTDPRAKAILARDTNGQIIGWSLAFMTGPRAKRYRFHFFVDPAYRGQKIGSRLMQRAMKIHPEPMVYPHDELSAGLFNKYRKHIRPVYSADLLNRK